MRDGRFDLRIGIFLYADDIVILAATDKPSESVYIVFFTILKGRVMYFRK